MPGPPTLQGPFTMPMFNRGIPRKVQPWLYLLIAFCFQLSSGFYGGAMAHAMGDTTMMREDALMIVLAGVVGVNMPFPFLFRFKFRFTNRQLLLNAALVVAACNVLSTLTENVPLLCALNYVSCFFKLCGTFECMSNIQLWMTPKRDFNVFFPLLYCIVVGNMSLAPWLTIHLTYVYQDWHTMNWVITIAMLLIALFVYTCTHNFRFMKPLPLVSLDWLGCALWSALMLEVIFLFNYGEYYNWWDSRVWRTVAWMLPVTLYFTIMRMTHIRHAYIHVRAWQYSRLVPLLGLFCIVELVTATPKVLQSALTGSVLHFATLDTSVLYLWEWVGTIAGCLFCLLWHKTLRIKYTYQLTVGMLALVAYEVQMYFLVQPGLPVESLVLPTLSRTFGVAIFFTALTVYLEDLMPFQHFFMGLTMLGLIRNGVVETVCSGIYGFFLRHHIADNMARGLPYEPTQHLLVSVKQLYGVTCIVAVAVLLILLLWNIQPVRSTLKKMPYWNVIGREARGRVRRLVQQEKAAQ